MPLTSFKGAPPSVKIMGSGCEGDVKAEGPCIAATPQGIKQGHLS